MINNFEDLNLIDPILKSLKENGYSKPTPVQTESIPNIFNGKDILALAQTGTGKTGAFTIPILQDLQISKETSGYKGIQALILTPTRELATQVNSNIETYGKYTDLNATAVFGGIPRKVQIDYLSRDINILTATPGRLLDLIDKGFVNLSALKYFVLDEADNMLNLGFEEEMNKVIELLPSGVQILMFSATMPTEIKVIADKILSEPVNIKIERTYDNVDNIDQSLYYVDKNSKSDLLIHIIKNENIDKAFIFVNTRKDADILSSILKENGLKADATHSDRSQLERQNLIEGFRNNEIDYLIATDVVARGIDIKEVPFVINIDLPQEKENYVHRIGRTGRAGMNGKSITFCSPQDLSKLKEIEAMIKKKINVIEKHPFSDFSLLTKLLKAEDELNTKKEAVKKHSKKRKR